MLLYDRKVCRQEEAEQPGAAAAERAGEDMSNQKLTIHE